MARASSPRAPEALITFTREVFAQRNPARWGEAVVDAVGRVIASDYTVVQEIDAERLAFGSVVQRPAELVAPRDVPRFLHYVQRDHPLIREFARDPASKPRALSDFMSQREYHRTGLYAECYRALGVEFQLGTPVPIRRRGRFGRFLVVNRRRRDFTDDERRFLNFARHQAALALRNAEAFEALQQQLRHVRAAFDHCDRAVAIADSRGVIRLCTESARVVIEKYFGPGRPSTWLPQTLRDWTRQWVAELGQCGARVGGRPLVIERGGERLLVRLVPDWEHRECLLLFDETRAGASTELHDARLSGRESEILAWVARGKTNADIAAILAISARTVQKHLEHVFEKLGVETRTAAVARVRGSLDR